MKNITVKICGIVTLLLSTFVFTQAQVKSVKTKVVREAAMYPSRNIIQNAMNSKDHTTLAEAVKPSGKGCLRCQNMFNGCLFNQDNLRPLP
jgi:hypothetical protein